MGLDRKPERVSVRADSAPIITDPPPGIFISVSSLEMAEPPEKVSVVVPDLRLIVAAAFAASIAT